MSAGFFLIVVLFWLVVVVWGGGHLKDVVTHYGKGAQVMPLGCQLAVRKGVQAGAPGLPAGSTGAQVSPLGCPSFADVSAWVLTGESQTKKYVFFLAPLVGLD